MLWPATNHTEFKLYAFSFNTHHAPETAAACRIEAAVATAAAVHHATTAAAMPAVTLLRIAMVLQQQQRLVLKGVNDSNRVRPYIP